MNGMLLAERAILVQLQSFRIVLLVLHRVVVPVLAFGAFKSNFRSVYGSHRFNSMQKNHTSRGVFLKSIIFFFHCQPFLEEKQKDFAAHAQFPPHRQQNPRQIMTFSQKTDLFPCKRGGFHCIIRGKGAARISAGCGIQTE